MNPQIIAAIVSGLDFLFTRIEQSGVELTDEELEVRRQLRKALVEQATNLPDPNPDD